MKRLLIFGYGFTGAALVRRLGGEWAISATSRNADTRAGMAMRGLDAVDPADTAALAATLESADAILIAAPPGESGCPGLHALAPLLTSPPPSSSGSSLGPHVQPAGRSRAAGVELAAGLDPRDEPEDDGGIKNGTQSAPVIAYLSTTGVYGDRAGGWVREDSPPAPASPEAHRRLEAEQGWRCLGETAGAPLFVFRLPGIYGPGRSALDRVREGTAKRWVKPGQVFSRIHVGDLADALARALDKPERAGVYALCDDEPAAPADVTAFAARLLGVELQPEAPLDPTALSPMARRFWAESKRVSNARAKAALGWRPAYPTYREGLWAVVDAEAAGRR